MLSPKPNRLTAVTSLLALGFAAACGEPEEPEPCREGTQLADDGHCYPSYTPTVYEALLHLPDCDPVSLDGNIDFKAGCVGTGCVGMTFDQLNTAFDEYAPCESASGDYVNCTWSIGITASFEDEDDNLEPDNGSQCSGLLLTDPATGASLRGTGVGANPRCAVDELGTPTYASVYIDEDTTWVRYLAYEEVGAYFYDVVDEEGGNLPDGIIEEIYLN
jgi:hypothetical protein